MAHSFDQDNVEQQNSIANENVLTKPVTRRAALKYLGVGATGSVLVGGVSVFVGQALTTHAAETPTPFITDVKLSVAVKVNLPWLGLDFTVADDHDIVVHELARWVVKGDKGTHTLKIVHARTGEDVASTTIALAGATPGQFLYAALPEPVILRASENYYLVSSEESGDSWYTSGTTVTTTSAGRVENAVYFPEGYILDPPAGHAFVPLNFSYELGNVPRVPDRPVNIRANVADGTVYLSWDYANRATGYTIMRSDSPDGPFSAIGTTTGTALMATGTMIDTIFSSTEFADTGLTNGQTYYYAVVGTNVTGAGPQSHTISAVPQADDEPWKELLVKDDGSFDWHNYTKIAQNLDQTWARDYWLGPRYSAFHPTPEDIPTVFHLTDGEITNYPGGGAYAWGEQHDIPYYIDHGSWWAPGGQLIHAPNFENDSGIVLARKATTWPDLNSWKYVYVHYNLSWMPSDPHTGVDSGEWWVRTPDYSVLKPWTLTANNGNRPKRPVGIAYARIGGKQMNGIVVYQNGLVTTAHNDGQVGAHGAAFKLPDDKVPTAVAVTDDHEFALVTVWDIAAKKGQVAVIAIQGQLMNGPSTELVWGLPNWFLINDLKLLGFIDLPFAAPSSISIGMDQTSPIDPRAANNTVTLSVQSERDKWNKTADSGHTAAQAGYAIVASRSENKVTFIDMQPLYQFYRQMYFTTPDNYAATQNVGHADNQWPYTFSNSPEQTPVVTATFDVTAPTAVVGGYMRAYYANSWVGDANWLKARAYVATLDGQLLRYTVGDLITTASDVAPTLEATTAIGNNPTFISLNQNDYDANIFKITCRGDRSVLFVQPDGTITKTLRDSRIQDPVMANGGNDFVSRGVLTVLDFNGEQAHTYLYDGVRKGWYTNSFFYQLTHDFEHTHSRAIPGKPFIYQKGEVF